MAETAARGGARPGAGRKKLGAKAKQRVVAMLPPVLLALLDDRACAESISRSEALTRCLGDWHALREIGIQVPVARPAAAPQRLSNDVIDAVTVALEGGNPWDATVADEVPEFPPDDLFDHPKSIREDLRDFLYRLEDFGRLPSAPARLTAVLARAVRKLELPGHEDGLIEDLAIRQLRKHQVSAERYVDFYRPVPYLERELLNRWADFVEGRICIRVRVPNLNYTGGLTWQDLSAALGWSEEVALSYIEPYEVPSYSSGPDDPNVVPGYTTTVLENFLRDRLAESIERALGSKGLMRGPCKGCGFQRWPVVYRAPGAPGRPPLEWDYCPACQAQRERARQAGNKRRHRARKATQSTTP